MTNSFENILSHIYSYTAIPSPYAGKEWLSAADHYFYPDESPGHVQRFDSDGFYEHHILNAKAHIDEHGFTADAIYVNNQLRVRSLCGLRVIISEWVPINAIVVADSKFLNKAQQYPGCAAGLMLI